MKAIHARLSGFTASVRVPFLVSGTQLASPLPLYSTLLGLLSCCAGRDLSHDEVRIGFTYAHRGETIDPVERLIRWGVDTATGRLSLVKERGVGQRSFHVDPVLDLYVAHESAGSWLSSPAGVPCLGRSQDVVWIESVQEIELVPTESGLLSGTWLPFSPGCPPGRMLRFVEYYRNDLAHRVRLPGPSGVFVALPMGEPGTRVTMPSLYRPTDTENPDAAIYLHEWTS